MSASLPTSRNFVVDVRDWGARGDGVADDTDALQVAVSSVQIGGVVRVPPGTYRVRVADAAGVVGVRLVSHMTLELMPGATLAAIPTDAEMYNVLLVQDVTDVTIRGGTLLGERAAHLGSGGEHGFGIAIRGATGVIVDGVFARDFWGDGFYVGTSYPSGTGNSNLRFIHCRSENNRRQGLSIVNARDVVVEACTFAGTNGTNPQAGIDLEPNPSPATRVVEDVRVVSSHFVGNAGYGVLVTGDPALAALHRIVVSGNTMIGDGEGIVVSADGVVVANNIIASSQRNGVRLETAFNVVLRGNLVRDSGQHGIYVASCADCLVSSNDVQSASVAAPSQFDGIAVGAGATRSVVSGNIIRSVANPLHYGIEIATGATGNVVTDNDLPGLVLSDRGTGTVTTSGNRD